MSIQSATAEPLHIAPRDLAGYVGRHLGYSPWRRVTQHDVDRFADVTDDHQWIHVDPERAAAGPFGACVAHGFLTLALLAPLVSQVFEVGGAGHAINHRVDRVRFRAPVPVGSNVRAGVRLASVRSRARSFLEVVVAVSIELEGGDLACTAEQTTLYPGLG
jgi:acyl dehydratase